MNYEPVRVPTTQHIAIMLCNKYPSFKRSRSSRRTLLSRSVGSTLPLVTPAGRALANTLPQFESCRVDVWVSDFAESIHWCADSHCSKTDSHCSKSTFSKGCHSFISAAGNCIAGNSTTRTSFFERHCRISETEQYYVKCHVGLGLC